MENFLTSLSKVAIISRANPNGDITYVNHKFCEISGYSEAELLGRNHRIVNSAQHPKEFFTDLWQTISSGTAWHGEICNRKKNGDFYWVYAIIVPIIEPIDVEKNVTVIYEYVSIRFDITERKTLEASVNAK